MGPDYEKFLADLEALFRQHGLILTSWRPYDLEIHDFSEYHLLNVKQAIVV